MIYSYNLTVDLENVDILAKIINIYMYEKSIILNKFNKIYLIIALCCIKCIHVIHLWSSIITTKLNIILYSNKF